MFPAHIKTKMHVPSWQTVLQVVNLGPGLLLSYDSIFSPHFESSHAGLHQADKRKSVEDCLLEVFQGQAWKLQTSFLLTFH